MEEADLPYFLSEGESNLIELMNYNGDILLEQEQKIHIPNDSHLFRDMLDFGYTNVAYGSQLKGVSVNDRKIVGMFVFYNPDGRVCIYEVSKQPNAIGASVKEHLLESITDNPTVTTMSEKEAEEYLKKFKIELQDKRDLSELVSDYLIRQPIIRDRSSNKPLFPLPYFMDKKKKSESSTSHRNL